MVFQGRSIQAKVELDLEPLALSITEANKMLQGLGGAFEFDTTHIKQLETYMGKVRDIFKMVSDEALKINEAFANIQGIRTLIENLEIVKAKMETIHNDVDKINQSILKMDKEASKLAQTEERIDGLMKNGLSTVQGFNTQMRSFNAEMRRAEKEAQGLLSVHKGVTSYLTQESELMASSLKFVNDKIAEEERELAVLGESFALQQRISSLVKSDVVTESDLVKLDDEQLAILRAIVGEEEKILGVQKMQTAETTKQNAERMGGLAGGGKTPKGNQLDSPTYLGRRIGSMAVTMWGFNELMDVYGQTMSHINAESQKDYFAKRLNMSAKELNGYNKELADYQKQYQKLDMTVVGANALETASKYKVENESLGDLTEVMAIYGSEFVKQGRSQEDSILAVNDALDGELRRLKEVGIGAEELKATGLWDGDETDKAGMLQALLKIAEERGYDQTAKDITNLNDAISTLEVKLSIDLARAFGIVEPLLRDVIKDFITMLETAEWLGSELSKLGQKVSKFFGLTDDKGKATARGNFLEEWVAWAITLGISLYGAYKILKPILGMFGKLKDVTTGVGKGAEEVATTGGTVAKDIEKGGFKSEFKKLGRNLGIMARVFIEVAIGLVMAYALLEEAMYLIARLGDSYERMKPQFDKGAKFLKDYGIWILAVGGAMAVALQYVGKLPQIDWKSQVQGFLKIALGLGEAMVLISEAIVLLIAPMTAIELLGYMYDTLNQDAIAKGNEVIGMFADALHYIASDGSIQLFILGLGVASAVLGFTADTVAIPLVIGIATALGLVAEAIGLLIVPLVAVEMLGEMANELNEDAVKKGAETIGLIAEVLKALEPAVRKVLEVDFEVFGIGLVEKGNQIVNGKGGLQSLTQDILPNLISFVEDLRDLEMPTDLDVSTKVQAITQMANQIAPLFTAMNNLNNVIGTGGILGKATTWLGGVMDSHMGTGLKPQLDRLYNNIKDVMDFANKLGGLGSVNTVNTTAITQTTNAIAQLKVKLDQFVSTITGYADKVKGASVKMGNALPTGFQTGSANFGTAVISVLANGIAQVQARYNTMHNAGKTLGQKLSDGFEDGADLKQTTITELGYALSELDKKKDDFYNKGKVLGEELSRGYDDGVDMHSPGRLARTTASEMGFIMEALDNGKQMMYNGGKALGSALATGYAESNANLRTNVDVLASKGVNNSQLQANATTTQANTKGKGQTQQSLNPTINIDMSNSTVIGITDLNTKIQQAVEQAIVRMNSPNGAIGY